MSISKIRTSDGAEHGIDYEGLENKPAVLGEPIHVKSLQLCSERVIDHTANLEFDLSSYLPDDGEVYRIWVRCWAYATGKNNAARVEYKSSIDKAGVLGALAFTADYANQIDIACTNDVLIGSDRKLIAVTAEWEYSCKLNIVAIRYQKVNVIID